MCGAALVAEDGAIELGDGNAGCCFVYQHPKAQSLKDEALFRFNRLDWMLRPDDVGIEPAPVWVGADRIAANGDVANKIGTYGLAILARAHDIPFYVAAPISTLDMSRASGDLIPIEERGGEEISNGFGRRTAPQGVAVYNPAFDVTPCDLVSAIITEKGVAYPPFGPTLHQWVEEEA